MALKVVTWLISIVLLHVASPSPEACAEVEMWNGTYTILNKASLRRISSSEHGFSATRHGSINPEHRWRLIPQGNDTFLIVNADHGMRIFAQASKNQYDGFLTTDHGPIYQDQLWWLVLQEDGSYAVVNVRSGRRIMAREGLEGALGFMAISTSGPFLEDQTWWLINQDRDDAGFLRQKLRTHAGSVKPVVNSMHIMDIASCEENRSKMLTEMGALKNNNARLNSQLMTLHSKLQEASDAYIELESICTLKALDEGLHAVSIRQVAALLILGVLMLAALSFVRQFAWGNRCMTSEHCMDLAPEEAHAALPHPIDAVPMLADDFPYHISNMDLAGEEARIVKILCPGVQHADIEINLIWNGCDVTINRQSSLGVLAKKWSKRIQFNHDEGQFEFKEDQMQLEHGFLQLVFRPYPFHNRAVRFPQHFNLASSDDDALWDYTDHIEIMPTSPVSRAKRKSSSMSSQSTASSLENTS